MTIPFNAKDTNHKSARNFRRLSETPNFNSVSRTYAASIASRKVVRCRTSSGNRHIVPRWVLLHRCRFHIKDLDSTVKNTIYGNFSLYEIVCKKFSQIAFSLTPPCTQCTQGGKKIQYAEIYSDYYVTDVFAPPMRRHYYNRVTALYFITASRQKYL